MNNKEVSKPQLVLPSYDLTDQEKLPDLSKANALPTDLTSTYWSPVDAGDSILAFYQGVQISKYEKDGKEIDLPCALLLVQDPKTKNYSNMRNGSRKLVTTLKDHENKGTISVGTPLQITFTGKKKNKKNDNFSDNWSIQPLFPK